MNKTKFIVVSLCCLISALLVLSLRKNVESITDSISNVDFISSSALHLLGVDDGRKELMDIGYLTKIKMDPNSRYTAISSRKDRSEVEQRNTIDEARNLLKIADQLLKNGRYSKARKLYDRAVSLAPSLPQALLSLGEFVEQHDDDVVSADQLFLRALTISPTDSRAISNRIRTKDLVAVKDQLKLDEIESKRILLSHVPWNSPALKRIQKEAYFHHLHHTLAIEGNTMDLREIMSILETGRSIGGKSIMEHCEVVGVDSALRYINETLLHRVGDITVHDILNIHLRVLGHTDPAAAGRFRTTQVMVGGHVPPPPNRLHHLMNQFVEWLNRPETTALHPIRYAALAHFHLVDIHPFIDGNGRTARLLMNFLLMQAGYPPVIIRHQDRLEYYDSLDAGHQGDTRPFVRFVSHCTEKTLDVYLWATQDAPSIGQDSSSIRHIGLGVIEFAKDTSHSTEHLLVSSLPGLEDKNLMYRQQSHSKIDPHLVDDLGVRFGESDMVARPAVHSWLFGKTENNARRKGLLGNSYIYDIGEDADSSSEENETIDRLVKEFNYSNVSTHGEL